MKKILFIPALLAALLLANGCARRLPPKTDAPVPVLAATAVETNVPVQINPPPVGHVVAYSTVTVHSQIQGMIRQIHFQEGQAVKRGDPLFTIDPRPPQAALEQAQANLQRDTGQWEYQKANFARDQELLASKIISQNQIDTDKAGLDAASGTVAADRAAITNALLNLGYCHICAPCDGVTGALQKHEGDVVKAPDDSLLTINQIHPIYVQFGVPEQFLPEIRREMRRKNLTASVTFQNLNAPPPRGDLTFVDNTVDPTTGMIQLRATFPNTNSTLWPGQFVQVQLTLSELTNAVVVPSPAVQTGQDGEFVYVVQPDQTVREQPVTAGITYNEQTVIAQGLAAGETVVTDGQLRLAPGVKVSMKMPEAGGPSAGPITNAK